MPTPAKKIVLTDRALRALAPAKGGKRYMVCDAAAPHLGARVTDRGTVTFIVFKRTAGRLVGAVIGKYPAVKLADARKRAAGVLATLADGKHPREVERERRLEELKRRRDTFGAAVEAFLADGALDGLRTARATEATLRREFLGQVAKRVERDGERLTEWSDGPDPAWRGRPVAGIARRDAIKAERGKHAARAARAVARRLFSWAADGERFGVDASPCVGVSDRTLGIKGRDLKRSRVLADDELADVWAAADGVGFPFGRAVQLLALTGQRLGDVLRAKRGEVDLDAKVLSVPPERYKTGVAHEVPLAPLAVEILRGLPKFAGPFLFTTTGGDKAIGALSKNKAKLDRAVAERRREDGREPMPPWVIHDLRRTVRTRLMSDCGVDAFVAERVIGHALPGLHGVYDQGSHRQQKREALEKWAARLAEIVGLAPEPKGAGVVPADEVERRRRRKGKRA